MIGGLLQNEAKTDVEQVPWLGSLPVIGPLFSSRSYQTRETDLAIIVTPRLVRPARPGSASRRRSTHARPANDAGLLLERAMPRSRAPTSGAARPRRPVHRTHPHAAEGRQPCRRGQELEPIALARLCSATTVAGCSDMYYDRRETISLGAGDAVATNKVTHMIDPWPRHSMNNAHRRQRPADAGGAGSLQPRQGLSRRCSRRRRRRITRRCSSRRPVRSRRPAQSTAATPAAPVRGPTPSAGSGLG